jgi:hypothetical protein
MNKIEFSKLQDIYSMFREADKLVTPEINTENYTRQQIEETNDSYNKFYLAFCDIRHKVGLLLDEVKETTD